MEFSKNINWITRGLTPFVVRIRLCIWRITLETIFPFSDKKLFNFVQTQQQKWAKPNSKNGFYSPAFLCHFRILAHPNTKRRNLHQLILFNVFDAVVQTISQWSVKNHCNSEKKRFVSSWILKLAKLKRLYEEKIPVTSLLERIFVAAFFLHILRPKSPGLWWIPTIWPLYTSTPAPTNICPLSCALARAYDVDVPSSKATWNSHFLIQKPHK